jgi:hypothetical protein
MTSVMSLKIPTLQGVGNYYSEAACWRFIWGVEKGLKSKPLLWAKQYKTFFGGSLLEIHLGSGKGA